MAGTTLARGAGFTRAYAVQTSTAGIPTDIANLSQDAAAAQTLTRLFAAQSADLTIPEDDVVAVEGDDGVDGQFNFESIELINFTLTVGRQDLSILNTIQGTTNIDLQSTWEMGLIQPKDRDFQDMFLLFTRRAQNSDSAGRYENIIIPNATMSYLGSAWASRQAGAFNYSVTANRVTKTFYGATLGSGVGTKESTAAFVLYTENPVAIDVWREDGTETDFTPGFTPRTGGTVLAWTWDESGTPSTTTVTYNTPVASSWNISAGTADDLNIILYETA